MININYNSKNFEIEKNSNGFQILKLIDKNLLKNAVAIKYNEQIFDLSNNISSDGVLEIINDETSEGLEIIRHSSSHLLASAVKELYSNIKIAIGPAIENGFYYDFDWDKNFSLNDLEEIEHKMFDIIKREEKIIREELSKKDAINLFKSLNEDYKIELINEISDNEIISIYRFGNFIDLCRGPHVPSLKFLKNFKLSKIAGAYWKGDSNNKMLQRIYGYAFNTKEKLDEYLTFLEESEKRDHRKICKIMDLLHFEYDYAPGAPFFHQKGLQIYNKLIAHIREKQDKDNYIEISTPRVMDKVLWEISGHWDKYGAHNYSGMTEDKKQFCIKPMNCPGSILVYKQGITSYKDLPLKLSEFGKVNRYEASGALFGLLRVREFTQDDAHIFCTIEQMDLECKKLITFLLNIYKDFNFNDVKIKLSTRPENRIGDDLVWDKSEQALSNALKELNLPFTIFEGEGAFYGPKLEFVLKDSIGRDWQMGTIQLDMNLPQRFDISYINEKGQKQQPIMFHRAILGSIERFMGILIEETEGKLPLWLNPLPIAVTNISEESEEYAKNIFNQLKDNNLKTLLDISSEKISYKVRNLSLQKIPYILVVGKNEAINNKVNIRILGNQNNIEMSLEKFIKIILKKINYKQLDFELKDNE